MGHHCCSKQKVKRGLWSPEEDEKLVKYITTHGHGCWSSIPKLAGLQRCGKSCRLRWINYLRPEVKRGSFTEQEERVIIDVHRIIGNRWAQIAKHLPGRTDNEVKNFWNSCIKKKLIAQGLDPKTHNLLSSTRITNKNNNTRNNLHIYQEPTSIFCVNSQMRDGPMDTASPRFITLPPTPPSIANTAATQIHTPIFHEPMTFPSYDYPNLGWSTTSFKDKNSQVSFDFSSRSSIESVPNFSSPIIPSGLGLGLLDENLIWGAYGVEPLFEPPRQEEMLQPQGGEKKALEAHEAESFDETNEVKGGSSSRDMQTATSFNTSNFDLDHFVESTLMSCGTYCNVSSMDQFAWDC